MAEIRTIYHKNSNYKSLYDDGYDLNKDRHCDLDGWFVNTKGRHTPILHQHLEQRLVDRIRLNLDYKNYLQKFSVNGKLYGNELKIFKYYTLNNREFELSSPVINRLLRNHEYMDTSQISYVKTLNYVINMFSLTDDITVYRGIGLNKDNPHFNKLLSYKCDDIIEDSGFCSTSYDPSIATEYANLDKSDSVVLMKIKLTKRTNCIPLFNELVGSKKEEFEILLKTDSKLKVKGKEYHKYNGKTVVMYYLES